MRILMLVLLLLGTNYEMARAACVDAAAVGKDQEIEIKFQNNVNSSLIKTSRIRKIDDHQVLISNLTEEKLFDQKSFSDRMSLLGVFEKTFSVKSRASSNGAISRVTTYELSDSDIANKILNYTDFDMIKVIYSKETVSKTIGLRQIRVNNVPINRIYHVSVRALSDEFIRIEGCDFDTKIIELIENYKNSSLPEDKNFANLSKTRIYFSKSFKIPMKRAEFRNNQWHDLETAFSVRVIQ